MRALCSTRTSATSRRVAATRRSLTQAPAARRVSRRTASAIRAAAEPAGGAAPNPVRQVLSSVVSSVYKMSAASAQVDPRMPPLWQGIMRLDRAGVDAALAGGASPDERSPMDGQTPLLYIAKAGHYKYPPAEIPAALVKAGADLEAKDAQGRTALEVALLSGWQNIAELLIKSGASTAGVAGIKASLTCPDCKRIVQQYKL